MTSDNARGFFNWQGNNLSYNYVGNYVVTALIVLGLIFGIVFRGSLRNYFLAKQNQKVLFFKNINSFWQTIGFLMIGMWVFRIVILTSYNYPLYFEHIGLHLCRLHFIMISLLLAFKKTDWIRFICYLSFFGAIIGITFGNTQTDFTSPNNIFGAKNFTYYSAGVDSYYYWDFHLTHLLVGMIPVIISIGINKKTTTVHFYRMCLFYFGLGFLVFGINFATDYAQDQGWRSNYWFMGRNRNNEFSNLFGPFTRWPQNLFFYLGAGLIYFYLFHFMFISLQGAFKQDLCQFFQDHNRSTFSTIFQLQSPLK